jgi:glucokinase
MVTPAHAIGIDIGGTKTALAIVSARGAIEGQTVLPTEAGQGFARAVQRLITSIEALLAPSGLTRQDIAGIGIGCAGPIDPQRGLINNPYTLAGWDRCDIVTPLRERFQRPVYLENDADMAALGECFWGAGRGFNPVVMLTFGTGVGGATVVNGEIYRGANGEHPELGHLPVVPDGPECCCGIRGCLESLASGTAIGMAGRALGLPDARAVFQAAQEGQHAAKAIIDRAADAAATAAWTICHSLWPQRLVLGGGIMDDHFDLFAEAMQRRVRPATQISAQALSIAPARLGNDAGIVGAAGIAAQRSRTR